MKPTLAEPPVQTVSLWEARLAPKGSSAGAEPVGRASRPPTAAPRRRAPALRSLGEGGFTLIELLTVIAIIVLLAGLVVGISSYANRHAVESRTKAEIAAICSALENYKADYGGYPPLDADVFNQVDANKGGITNYYPSAVSVPPTAAWPNTNGWLNIHYVWRAISGTNTPRPYMVFSSRQLKTVTNTSGGYAYTVIVDPNGNPYGYNPIAPQANPQTYDLWSAGVDGKSTWPNLSSTNDDLGNWQR
jgi:prepilin-type N-terminal cleavage/methylation domain-containing protein